MGLGDASAGLGLHHQDFLAKSLSTHEALCFGGIYARLIFAHFGAKRCWACRPRSPKRCKYRPKKEHAAICGVLLRLRFRAGLRAVLFGLLFLGPLARTRARPHVSLLGWGPAGAQKAGIPGIMQNLTSHNIAQDMFLIQKP